jgi:hypothetical protein
VNEIAVVPLFVSVICCVGAAVPTAVLTYVRLAGDRLTAVPSPANATVCGEPYALSAMFRLAVCNPEAAGVNVTIMVQDPAAATLLPQVLVCE